MHRESEVKKWLMNELHAVKTSSTIMAWIERHERTNDGRINPALTCHAISLFARKEDPRIYGTANGSRMI